MKLEDQVCTLEQAKRLNELGIKQSGFFSWYETIDRDDIPRLNLSDENGIILGKQAWENKHSAFTVSELLQILPSRFDAPNFARATLIIGHAGNSGEKWGVFYLDAETETVPFAKEIYYSLAHAAGAMLIFLGENKLANFSNHDKRE